MIKNPAQSNIWIIDDDPVAIFYIQRLCEITSPTASIIVFSSAQQAIEALEQHTGTEFNLPDIVLLDIHMPVMTGWDFLRWVDQNQAQFTSVKIFLMSSSIHPKDTEKAKGESNVKQYLLKPLSLSSIQAIIG